MIEYPVADRSEMKVGDAKSLQRNDFVAHKIQMELLAMVPMQSCTPMIRPRGYFVKISMDAYGPYNRKFAEVAQFPRKSKFEVKVFENLGKP